MRSLKEESKSWLATKFIIWMFGGIFLITTLFGEVSLSLFWSCVLTFITIAIWTFVCYFFLPSIKENESELEG